MDAPRLLVACAAALPLLAWAGECPVKGFEFVRAARDNMWSVLSARAVQGEGGCDIVNDALVSAGAKDGPGVTCEATFFHGGTLKAPWKIKKIRFAGADVELVPVPQFPTQAAQVTVRTRAQAAMATALTIEQVVLVTTDTGCSHWQAAFKE